ncbi:MAG: NUDIX domain-containing protein [Clostridiaceae bacterium]|jgi:8-oxo-dGTP diphosphatase|nr:NUDIX domain-containing protein [Clostridiaceae bacterium]
MTKVAFHADTEIAEDNLIIAIIASRYDGKWVFCKHRKRGTFEMPAGRREPNESIEHTARRELYEETGAIEFDLYQVSVYSVTENSQTNYGKLFFADIKVLKKIPEDSEMEYVILADSLPDKLTYEYIQTILFEKAMEYALSNSFISS